MNRQAAIEWLNKAWHHLSSGKLLYEANHYTDVIGIDLHYAVEVILKAFLAYENRKTHDLIEIANQIKGWMTFGEDEKKLMVIISTYHIGGSYPPKDRSMPSREELSEVIDFAEALFERSCRLLGVDEASVKR